MTGPVIVKRITGVEQAGDGAFTLTFNAVDRRAYELRVPMDAGSAYWTPPELYYEGELLDTPGWDGAAAALEGHTLAKRNPDRELLDTVLEIIASGGAS